MSARKRSRDADRDPDGKRLRDNNYSRYRDRYDGSRGRRGQSFGYRQYRRGSGHSRGGNRHRRGSRAFVRDGRNPNNRRSKSRSISPSPSPDGGDSDSSVDDTVGHLNPATDGSVVLKDRYVIRKELGCGTFGKVYCCSGEHIHNYS
jgi:hypothetical protein